MVLKEKHKKLLFWSILACIFSAHYYLTHSTNALVGSTPASIEWPLLVDILLTIPLLYYFLFKPSIKELLLKSAVFFALGIFIGSYIVPENNQFIWPYLTQLRYLIIAAFIIVELSLLISLFHIIKKAYTDANIEQQLQEFLEKKLNSQAIIQLYLLEIRVWLYSFFSRKKGFHYEGKQHFSYHTYNGNSSNQQGFMFIILFELPILHFILHMAWSPTVAYWVSGLTLYGLIFMYADYKATLIRPISVTDKHLIIRYGVWGNQKILLSNIKEVVQHSEAVKRSKHHIRFCQFGAPNVCVVLKPSKGISTPFSGQTKEKIYIGLDSPTKFISSLK